jgi:aspartyl-tRNA(Asn)/glutamyl-tRNA(Gln) amidotransferase subunit A
MEISGLTITEARRALDSKEYSAVELAGAHLVEIEKKNPELNAYLEVYDDVLNQAKVADEVIAQGASKPLTGIPLANKDNILIQGKRASAASKILENYTASYDATAIVKLKEHTPVFLGRTNMDEFAMGSSTENSAFGRTKNPHDTERVPGGSSGGSAAALASGLAVASLGSDTGGSIRQPASFCGVVGFKPTYGAVSRFGLIAMGSSLDQIGPLTKTVEDSKTLFHALRGADIYDSTTLPNNTWAQDTQKPIKKIGVPRDFLKEGIDPDILEHFEKTLTHMHTQGYEVSDVSLPHLSYALPMYYVIMPAEASTNLARYDGIRYGLSVDGADVLDIYNKTRGSGFGQEVRRRILIGTFVLSSGYADQYYRKATAVRNILRADFRNAFDTVDVIAMPTTPTPAFKVGEKADPVSMYVADIFTASANLAGVPAISIPMSTVSRDTEKLPVGVQFIAPHGKDDLLFTIGEEVEKMA